MIRTLGNTSPYSHLLSDWGRYNTNTTFKNESDEYGVSYLIVMLGISERGAKKGAKAISHQVWEPHKLESSCAKWLSSCQFVDLWRKQVSFTRWVINSTSWQQWQRLHLKAIHPSERWRSPWRGLWPREEACVQVILMGHTTLLVSQLTWALHWTKSWSNCCWLYSWLTYGEVTWAKYSFEVLRLNNYVAGLCLVLLTTNTTHEAWSRQWIGGWTSMESPGVAFLATAHDWQFPPFLRAMSARHSAF